MNFLSNSQTNQLLVLTPAMLKEFALEVVEELNRMQKPKEDDEWLSAKTVKENLHISHSTLWRWQTAGLLTPKRIGKKLLFKKSDVEKLLTHE